MDPLTLCKATIRRAGGTLRRRAPQRPSQAESRPPGGGYWVPAQRGALTAGCSLNDQITRSSSTRAAPKSTSPLPPLCSQRSVRVPQLPQGRSAFPCDGVIEGVNLATKPGQAAMRLAENTECRVWKGGSQIRLAGSGLSMGDARNIMPRAMGNILIAATAGDALSAQQGSKCKGWLTEEFFRKATAAKVAAR